MSADTARHRPRLRLVGRRAAHRRRLGRLRPERSAATAGSRCSLLVERTTEAGTTRVLIDTTPDLRSAAPRRRRRPPRRRRLHPPARRPSARHRRPPHRRRRTAARGCRSGPTPRPPRSCSRASPTSSSSRQAASTRRSSTCAASTGPSTDRGRRRADHASSPSASSTAASRRSASASTTSPTCPTSRRFPTRSGRRSRGSTPSIVDALRHEPASDPRPSRPQRSTGSPAPRPRRGRPHQHAQRSRLRDARRGASARSRSPPTTASSWRSPIDPHRPSRRPSGLPRDRRAATLATRTGVFSPSAVDGLMVYTQSFAVPCLLFRGLVDLDLGAVFDPGLLLSFYTGAVISFAARGLSRAPRLPPPARARRWRSASGRSSRIRCCSACRS